MKKFFVLSSLGLMLFSYACTTQGATPTPSVSASANPADNTSFLAVKAVIDQKCISCHSTTNAKDGISFSTEADINRMKNLIKREVSSKKMPPKGEPALTDAELSTIANW